MKKVNFTREEVIKIMEDHKEDTKTAKRILYWFISVVLITSGIIWFLNRGVAVVDAGIVHYEEFQEIYNTCDKLNMDLCNMQALPDSDKMFEQFSKAQRINTLREQINRWVQEYNAKSKMINHSIWKSSALPYQLQTNQYNCY